MAAGHEPICQFTPKRVDESFVYLKEDSVITLTEKNKEHEIEIDAKSNFYQDLAKQEKNAKQEKDDKEMIITLLTVPIRKGSTLLDQTLVIGCK